MHHASSTRYTLTLWILLIVFCLAIAPAQAQNLFVANQAGNTIREFSPSGEDLGYFATTGLSTPRGIAFDKRGNLYAANAGYNTIRVFSRSGEDLGYFATTGMIGPVGLAFSPEREDEDDNEDGGDDGPVAHLVGSIVRSAGP
jgi:hypothetical protein